MNTFAAKAFAVVALLFAIVFFVARITDKTVPTTPTMRCIALENKRKQGLGLTYDEMEFKRKNCDLY